MLRRCATFRRSHTSSPIHFKYERRYPYLVAFHQLPWNTVEPGTHKAHKLLAPHYQQLLKVAATGVVPLPGFVLPAHPDLPADKALSWYPGMVYALPLEPPQLPTPLPAAAPATLGDDATEGVTANVAEWMPSGWTSKRVSDPLTLGHYGPMDATLAPLRGVYELTSADMRIVGNAVAFGRPHFAAGGASNKKKVDWSAVAVTGTSSLGSLGKETGGFALFHFYRPNRAPSELTKPLEKFYVHGADTSVLDGLDEGAWSPAPAVRPAGEQPAKPMPKYTAPVTPQYGLPDREAQLPGDTFGHRDRQWGFRW